MPIVALPHQRHTLQDEGFSLRITIPSRKNILVMIFLCLWLLGWAFGEFAVGGMLFAGLIKFFSSAPETLPEIGRAGLAALSGVGLFLLVWFTGWTAGGVFAIYTILWQLVGKENIEIGNDTIKLQRGIFGLGKMNEYPAAHIKDLRVSPGTGDGNAFGWPRAQNLYGLSGGLIAFDYGAKTFRFAIGVEEAEARQILEEITSRFPQYRSRPDGTR